MKRRSAASPPAEQAGLYVRVSLDRAASGLQDEILSPDTQEDRGRQYCGAQGWTVALVERDIDESAYRQHYSCRAGLMRLLEAVDRREISKIVVWKFSRLSRRLKEFIEICDRLEAAGAGVVSVTEQVDTSTPAGRLIRNILASFAQFQSEEISEQIFESWRTKAMRGERPPGLAPFGTVNNRGVLEPHPETHMHLLTIYRLFVETGSVRAVWDYLAAQGVPAPRAAGWSLNTIRGILTNPVYIGRIEWAGDTYDGRWAPLVPEELWQEAQDQFAVRKGQAAPRRDLRPLTGILVCGECGRPLWTRYAKRSREGQAFLRRVYWCCAPGSLRRGCPVPVVDAEEAEDWVWAVVVQLLSCGEAGVELGRGLASGLGDRSLLERERVRLRLRGNQLFDLLADGSITREQFREQNLVLQKQLAVMDQAVVSVGRVSVDEVTSLLSELPPDGRRAVLEALGARVVVTRGGARLEALGVQVDLRARLVGQTWHFGSAYQAVDWAGPGLTDRQEAFLRRGARQFGVAGAAGRAGRPIRLVEALLRRRSK